MLKPKETETDPLPSFVIIHSHPSPGGFHTVTPATDAGDKPPHSTREEIHAATLHAAETIAKKYEGRPGETRVFSLDETVKEEAKP